MQVIGYTELLLLDQNDGLLTPEKTRQYGTSIMTGSLRMKNTINELLLLAEARDSTVITEAVNMEDIVVEVVDNLSLLIENGQASVKLPSSWHSAMGYGPWITEVWSNYIINAIKYGGKPPRVTMGSEKQADGYIRFWIQDNGPGIPNDKQDKLFRAFETLHRTPATGSGLGLSIVKRIIDRLGGSVGVESSGIDGEGSLFYFTLPEVKEE